MRNIKFKKDKISIKKIGKQRFWFGIISGFISAITIALIFNRTRELIRLLTSLSQDLLIFEKGELVFFNYFFVSLSTVLGLSITIWIWMGNPINKRKKHKLYKQQARTSAQLFFWLVMFLTAQLGSLFIYFSVAEVNSYDFPINLYQEHKLLFILIPVVIFIQNWFSVRLIYKTNNWILISLAISVITILGLYKVTTVDQNILNENYFARNKKHFEYIESILSRAKNDYKIEFNVQALNVLKQQKSYSSAKQIRNIKESFSKKRKVSIDTIIIQKIIIHNLKARTQYRYNYSPRTLYNWKYALPKDILKQINYFESDSNETKELFEVLKEEILLVNKAKIILESENENDFKLRSPDKEKKELSVNIMLVEQLIEVTNNLMNQERYSELNKILPKIEIRERHDKMCN